MTRTSNTQPVDQLRRMASRTSGGNGANGSHGPERIETVVIGGGQAGLATGYHLARRQIDFVILDANERIGDSWRNRWDSLRLFTPARYSQLPGMAFPAPSHVFPTKDAMADYLEAYARKMNLPVRHGVSVRRVDRVDDGYVVETDQGRLQASQVVVATGAYHTPRVPSFAKELDAGIRQFHSSDYRNPSQLQEGAVLVVGASNSGAEIAYEAARNHQTWLSGRDTGKLPFRTGSRADRLATPLIWFTFNHLLTINTPMGRKGQPSVRSHGGPLETVQPADLAAAGVKRVYERTVGARDGLPVLADGSVIDVTNVVWCTGFRPSFDWIDALSLDEDGWPRQYRGVVQSAPGLYIVGLPFLYSAASPLVGGVGRDAGYIARQIAQYASVDAREAATA